MSAVVAPLHVGLAEECKRNWGVGGGFIGEKFAKVRFSSEVEFEFEWLRDSNSRVIGGWIVGLQGSFAVFVARHVN